MTNKEELREKIRSIVLGDTPDHFLSDSMLQKPDDIMHLIDEQTRAARIEEIQTFGDEDQALTMHANFCRKDGEQFRKCFECYKVERLDQLSKYKDNHVS